MQKCARCKTNDAPIHPLYGPLHCDECNANPSGMRKKALSYQDKIKDLSPEEVLSGVQYGNDFDYATFGDKRSEDYSVERARQLKDLREAV